MNTAAKVRADKDVHPERYCANPRCLWRVVIRDEIKPCPKHPKAPIVDAPAKEIDEAVQWARERRLVSRHAILLPGEIRDILVAFRSRA